MPDQNDDIVFDGYRINWAGAGGGSFFSTRQSEGGESEEEFGGPPDPELPNPDEPNDTNPPKVAAWVGDPANRAAVQAAAEKLTSHIAQLTPRIAALSNTAVIPLANGQSITGAELKALWGKADFVVTDANFGPDRGGATEGFLSQIRYTTVEGYAAHGENSATGFPGLNFLIAHELIHMTDIAQFYYSDQYADYRAENPGLSEAQLAAQFQDTILQFRQNEQFANFGGLKILDALDLPEPPSAIESGQPGYRSDANFPVYGSTIEGP